MRRSQTTRDNLKGRTTYLKGLEKAQRDRDTINTKEFDPRYVKRVTKVGMCSCGYKAPHHH